MLQIKVAEVTKDTLDDMKIIDRETYDSIIQKLIKVVKENHLEMRLHG